MSRLRRSVMLGLVALLLLLPGCVELAEDQPTPTPIPTPAESNKPVYEVKLGAITQSIKSLGRVAASEEATLFFRQNGRLRRLYVDTNQKVKAGDVLAELEIGTLRTQITQAKLQLDIAQIRLTQAIEKGGGDATAVAQARASLESAQGAATRAQGDLDRLKAGPQAADVAAAQQTVVTAEAAFAKAQTDLARLKAGPDQDAVKNAELALEKAKLGLWSVQIRRDSACGPGPSVACQSANADVAAAETSVTQAQLALEKAQAPAKPDDIANAQNALGSAQAALDSARARLSQVKAGPKDVDVASAEQAVKSAKAALDSAQANYNQVIATTAKGGDYDVQVQQKQVELARVSLQVLEDQLDLSQIKAPFDGTVTSWDGREGNDVKAFTPVVTIANPKSLVISVELPASDVNKVQVGQEATIVFTSFPTDKLAGKVTYIPSLNTSTDPQLPSAARTIRLSFTAPANRVLELGALANVTISVQKKDNVLTLPNTAIRAFGGRRFVRLVNPAGRVQEVDVEIGINNDTDTEIVKGLREGQKVYGQ